MTTDHGPDWARDKATTAARLAKRPMEWRSWPCTCGHGLNQHISVKAVCRECTCNAYEAREAS